MKTQFPEVVDNTMRSSFVSCPKKFYYSHLRHLARHEKSIHLHFGGAFASGMEAVRKAYYNSDTPTTGNPDASLLLGFRAIVKAYDTFEDEIPFIAKNFHSCLAALEYYFSTYPLSHEAITPHFTESGKPCVEFSFAIEIPEVLHPETNLPLLYAGRFDMLGEFNSTLYVVDEKTTGYISRQFLAQWDLRAQFIGYCFGAQSFDYPVAGAIVRGLGIKAKGFDSTEILVPISPNLIAQWREQLGRDLQRMVDSYKESYFDINLADACTAYGGCVFKRLCLSANPERWIETEYVRHVWNPLSTD